MVKFRLAVLNTQPPHLYYGGVERRIIEVAKRLQNHADVTIYCGTKAGFRQSSTVEGATLIPVASTDKVFPLDNYTFNRNLCKKAATLQADVYEAHAVSGYGLHKALRRQGIKTPFIHTIHGVLGDEYEKAQENDQTSFRGKAANYFMHYLAKLEGQTAQDADLIVTISNYSLQKIRSHYNVDSAKVRIVPNGVDTERFKPNPDKTALRRQFGLGEEPCVLFVGNLIARKGLPTLLEAAKKVVKERTDTKFLIVGEGPLKAPLSHAIASAGLMGNFRFLGNLSEEQLPQIYNCADVFVLPSIQEGQGIVLLEAMASGVPVVAFDIGGVNEAVCNGETGLLVELGNVKALGQAVLKFLADSMLREQFGRFATKRVLEKFTWDTCANGMLEVYKEALNS
jgi:glycosyltransferase involved in cell wall biosynthesis